jgi:hypothetical protein
MLLREAAASVQTLAEDRSWVGGTLGVLAVLHTWSRTLEYHPHAHLLVTAGGLSADGTAWVEPAHPRFFMPGYALSQIFAPECATPWPALAYIGSSMRPCGSAPGPSTSNGRGEHAALYLSRYVYRVALTNQRLERFEHGRVTFRYTHARTHETRRMTLPVNVSSRASSNTYFHAASPRSAPTAS